MKKGGAYQKGVDFERQVCKRLSLWITKGTADDAFWRSAMSGGRATQSPDPERVKAVSGDICAVRQEGFALCRDFFIECKFYKDMQFVSLLGYKREFSLIELWKVCLVESEKYEQVPLMIAKQNRIAPVLLTNRLGAETLKPKCSPRCISYVSSYQGIEGCEAYIYDMEEFLEKTRPYR
tara:strand:- start:2750 stop:3286 length:537 start_codon:yes stop_codon:yes gene_type:complete